MDRIPIKKHEPEAGLAEFLPTDTVGVAHGGTGGDNAATALTNLGGASSTDLSTHTSDANIHFTEASIDHTNIQNIGTNTHAQIDTHIADTNLHVVISTINGQPQPTFLDTTRTKQLTVNLSNFLWAEANVGNNDFLQIGTASDALTAHIMPFDGTIVGYAVHCENTQGNTRALEIQIEGVVQSSTINVPSGADISNTESDLDLDVSQGERVLIHGEGSGGQILDTVITLYIRWRA